jgi:hypothetical protein
MFSKLKNAVQNTTGVEITNYATEHVLASFVSKNMGKNYERINLFLLMDCYKFLKKELSSDTKIVNELIAYIYDRLNLNKPGFKVDDFLKKQELLPATDYNIFNNTRSNAEWKGYEGGKSKRRKTNKKPKKRSRKTRNKH